MVVRSAVQLGCWSVLQKRKEVAQYVCMYDDTVATTHKTNQPTNNQHSADQRPHGRKIFSKDFS